MRKKYSVFIVGLICLLNVKTWSQNVGIGESNPLQKLHIDGTDMGLQTIRIEDLGTGQVGDHGQISGVNTQTSESPNRVVYVDGNGDMTARYAYGDNIQSIVATGSSQDIPTGTTYTDVTGLSITFIPRHPIVYVSFMVSGYINLPTTSHASQWLAARIERDAVAIGGTTLELISEKDGTASTSAGSAALAMYPVDVTVGVPVTINISARVGGGLVRPFTIDKMNYGSYMTIWD